MRYKIDLKKDSKKSKRWAIRAMKDALIYPWHITLTRE